MDKSNLMLIMFGIFVNIDFSEHGTYFINFTQKARNDDTNIRQ